MKTLTSFLVALLLLSPVLQAQTSVRHPDDPGATVVGTMSVTVELQPGTNRRKSFSQEIAVMRGSTGRIEYVGRVPNIRADGNDAEIDSTSSAEIFSQISLAVVQKGVDLGHFSSTEVSHTRVWFEACVVRSGSGHNTRFDNCGSSAPSRSTNFEITPDGDETIIEEEGNTYSDGTIFD